MIEPKIGEIFSLHGIKVKTCPMKDDEHCSDCTFAYLNCDNIVCNPLSREDATQVIFKKVEQTKIKPMEVKIQIPDNCELIKDGDTYIVKEKKQSPPRSWEEFCERYPITEKEAYINSHSKILPAGAFAHTTREITVGKSWCVSKEEAEAFLALMQLRQLRKAWVDTWEYNVSARISCYAIVYTKNSGVCVRETSSNHPMSFPTMDMAVDFFSCFKTLCETAKILL